MILSPADCARLRTLAEKASLRGKWVTVPCGDEPSLVDIETNIGSAVCEALFPDDADYIAACSPDVVLALLAALEQQQERIDEALALADRMISDDYDDPVTVMDLQAVAALLRGEGE